MKRNENKIHIVLIDSGIDSERTEFNHTDIVHINIGKFDNYMKDDIGHGTAIAFILSKVIKNSIIYSLKLYGKDRITTERDLIDALTYVYKEIPADIIHISSGVVSLDYKKEFNDICIQLQKKNILVVSAFDNNGIKSYPASFESVIGVYWSSFCTNVNEYIYVENSPINVMAYSGIMRLPWSNGTYKQVSGSSFSSAYITGLIARNLNNEPIDTSNVLDFLKKNAKQIIKFSNTIKDYQQENIEKVNQIKSAIIFPVNKETHAILGNSDLIKFTIEGVYDIRETGHVGCRTGNIIYGKKVLDTIIKSYCDINWNDSFDTVILGHVTVVSTVIKTNLIQYFLQKCCEYHKNIYCFDPISDYKDEIKDIEKNGNCVMSLHLDNHCIEDNTFGSLNKFAVPVVGVFGTSSKQGKYNLQLELRRRLLGSGYTVGQLGTEPSAILFGMDSMLPNGYNSNIKLSSEQEVYYVNNLLSKLNERDIVLVGAQSQTIPFSFGNINFYTFSQHNLLLASEPDVVVLAININDDLKYIKRIVKYIEEYFTSIVLAFVVYPFIKSFEYSIKGQVLQKATDEDIDLYAAKIERHFKKHVYVNGKESDMNELFNQIINFFQR